MSVGTVSATFGVIGICLVLSNLFRDDLSDRYFGFTIKAATILIAIGVIFDLFILLFN